ncbi:unnamed protein product [Sphenostylis stenocarpa]|uniref:Uncharacterized protein n=1 Tax=Sphenostylis stenocarpa TaxID=92480 RepID=A0AA86RYV5_9FABA|nr:unnamed protein product [Sphenostylis stenocarpa]
MGIPIRSGNINIKRPNEAMKFTIATFAGVVFGFFLGVSFPTLELTRMNLPSRLLPSIDLTYVDDNYLKIPTKSLWDAWDKFMSDRSMYNNRLHRLNDTKIWVPTNPRGAEMLPPKFVESESDFYLHRLWGMPHQ